MRTTDSSKVEIVRIGMDEYPEFCKLLEWRRTANEEGDTSVYLSGPPREFLQQFNVLDSKLFYIYAARVDGKFVSYINAIIIPKPDPRMGMMYIDELWTAPAFRQGGIATLLMREVFKLSKRLNLWRVRLYVAEDNDAARSYYRKQGFSEKTHDVWCEVSVRDIDGETGLIDKIE